MNFIRVCFVELWLLRNLLWVVAFVKVAVKYKS